MGRFVDEDGYLIDEHEEFSMLSAEDFESYVESYATFDWVIEKRHKDGTSDFEFKYAISEDVARDYAQSVLWSLPNVATVLVFKYHGKVSRVETLKWE